MGEENNESGSYNFKGNEKLTKKDLIFRQVSKCMGAFNQEMRSGYWIFSQVTGMKPQRLKYLGDSRKECVGCVNGLHDFLFPDFDKQMQEDAEKFYKEDNEFVSKNLTGVKIDSQKDAQWNLRIENYRKLYRKLLQFLKKKNWFEGQVISDV